MTPQEIEAFFTRSDGAYVFARWGRPIVPVVFGVDDATLAVVKGAFEVVVGMAGHKMAETDPEIGANVMVFFVRDWAELPEVPNLDRMIPDLAALVERLAAARANQYRIFRFDADGGIKAAFVFIRMDEHMEAVSADVLALSQAVQVILLWSDVAFQGSSALMIEQGEAVLRPDIGQIIRAAYDPMMPLVAQDAAHSLRLFARLPRVV